MKELNERQRAEHAVNMYEQQKSLLHNMEDRNKELEDKFSEVNDFVFSLCIFREKGIVMALASVTSLLTAWSSKSFDNQ